MPSSSDTMWMRIVPVPNNDRGLKLRLPRQQQPRGPLNVLLARKEFLLQRRRIRHGRVERADDAHGRVEVLEGLFLDDRRDRLADRAGASVLVDDEDAVAVPREGEDGLAVERRDGPQIEHG